MKFGKPGLLGSLLVKVKNVLERNKTLEVAITDKENWFDQAWWSLQLKQNFSVGRVMFVTTIFFLSLAYALQFGNLE